MLNLYTIYILLLPVLFLLNNTSAVTSDGLSLLTIKSAVDGGGATLSDWTDTDATPCRWTGVTCANISGVSDPQVVGISLAGKNLRGYIPPEIGNLTYLRRLNLNNNNFHGSIPEQIFNATSLHSVIISNNNLSGELPVSICNPPRIQTIDLSHNSISGTIQKLLGKCRELQRLILAGNQLSGEIPAGVFAGLANLIQLDLSSNSLDGSLPFDIGQLKSLSGTLNVSFNRFSGRLPESLGDLPLTVGFDLRHNNFSGEIPRTGCFVNQGPTAFLHNPSLCGPPLQKTCRESVSAGLSGTKSLSPVMGDNEFKKGLKPGLIILISMADALGVSLIGLLFVYLYWRKQDSNGCSCICKARFGGNHEFKLCSFPCVSGFPNTDSEVESEKGGGGGCGGGSGDGEGGELVAIDKGFNIELDELLRASAYVLGKSGLGIVYKVVLGNGIPVAVRRLGEGGEGRYKEFVAEVQAIGRVKHPNVVKLRAYYWAPDEKLLISDFISNGNLAFALRGRTSTVLTWSVRVKITKGIARGLAYLHEYSPRKFVHGDIKPSNILLDNEHQPYISDFGLSRLINITGNDMSSSSGGLMGGGFSYLKSTQTEKVNNYRAPEARASSNQPTQKWDVYSFGVVLLELLTGKSPELSSPTTSTSTEIPNLVKWVQKAFEEETPLSDMVDPILLQEVHAKKEVLTMFHLALACTEQDPEIRPRMKTVTESLEKIRV